MPNIQLLMGNEAIALGAIRAGVQVVTGYPGTPSTEIMETIARQPEAQSGDIYAEWSVNEKTALEVAAGAAYAGLRSMVTMKQVGLNVASDPLMSLNYVGVKGGMVIVVADDPGPISSQTEQDTRHFGEFAKLVVFDPSSSEEAYMMIADAFDCSERRGRPVIMRPTTRICHGYASVELLDPIPKRDVEYGFQKDGGRWVIFPSLSYRNHIEIERQLKELSEEFSAYSGNKLSGTGRKGIAVGGVNYAYLCEALKKLDNPSCKLLKVATVPFPERLGEEFLQGLDEVLVVEELDPVIENSLLKLCGKNGLSVKIRGKQTEDLPCAGENNVDIVFKAVAKFLNIEVERQDKQVDSSQNPPALPVRPPVLCAGCPHRASFFAVKQAAKGRKAVFSGDIGCYTLGNAQPLDMVDTCLCMGAGITVAQGLQRAEPDALHFAFIGDSTFFHTGIPGIINAVYNNTDIIVVILDNYTTAMTGNQTHPGIGKTVTGSPAAKVSIYDLVSAMGVSDIQRANPFDISVAKEAVKSAMEKTGVRVILFEGPCIAVAKGKTKYTVTQDKCTGCMACIKLYGCPAISFDNSANKAVISAELCTGCGSCRTLCAFGAFEEERT